MTASDTLLGSLFFKTARRSVRADSSSDASVASGSITHNVAAATIKQTVILFDDILELSTIHDLLSSMKFPPVCQQKTNAGGEPHALPLPAVGIVEEGYRRPAVSSFSPLALAPSFPLL